MGYCSSALRRGPDYRCVRALVVISCLRPRALKKISSTSCLQGETQLLASRHLSSDEGAPLWRKPSFSSPFSKLLLTQSLGGRGGTRHIMIQISMPGKGKLNRSQIILACKRAARTVQGDPGSRCQEPGLRGGGRGVGRVPQAMGGTNARREETGNQEAGQTSRKESQDCPEYFLPGAVLTVTLSQPPASFILTSEPIPSNEDVA